MEFPEPVALSEENTERYCRICDALEPTVLAGLNPTEDVDFATHRGSSSVAIEIVILNESAVTPEVVEKWLRPVQQILREADDYWIVRIWLKSPVPAILESYVLWLTIDRFEVLAYVGEAQVPQFATMDELHMHYWGKTFP